MGLKAGWNMEGKGGIIIAGYWAGKGYGKG
jgi:hypothetical protein